jgi:hypothetical protein
LSYGSEFNCPPIALDCCWIPKGFFGDFRDTNNGFAIHAVVIENLVTKFHGAQIVPRLEVTYAGPFRFAVINELAPGIGGRLLLHQPILGHLDIKFDLKRNSQEKYPVFLEGCNYQTKRSETQQISIRAKRARKKNKK